VDLFKLGEGTPPKVGVKTSEVVDGFYSFLGFTRLTDSEVIRRAIAKGIQGEVFGYVSGAPELGADGKYQVPLAKVRFKMPVAEDEIDLESGFLMMPQAIPLPVPIPGAGPPPGGGGPGAGAGTEPGSGTGQTPPSQPSGGPSEPAAQRTVEVSFMASRDQLYRAWDALANLADMAGKVSVSVKAESPEGFDKGKLENGVLEPLREADLIQ